MPLKPSRARIVQVLIPAVLVCAFVVACREASHNGGNVPKLDINQVVEKNATSLMEVPGVTGVAVGALDDGTPCVLVLILEDSEEIRARIPATIEGHPVKIFVSGNIEPMQGDSAG